ncbi:response regulator [Xanthobacter sediminis]|uniref:response regulator n=1 Tax=Xanthobacter sediminis TaxID=3119926 RepID=UPI00372A42C5
MRDQPAGRGTILLVEDEPFVALVAQQVLEDHGFAVTVATHGRAALAQVAGGGAPADALVLALVDMGLPDMGGDEVVRALRRFRPDLPVVIATGYAAEEVEARLAGTERVTIIRKPYDVATLRAALRRFGIEVPED